jgi:AcrR family transcriptional regulator
VLEAAQRQLADHGYEGMSVSAVAEAARTTRQAVYRRWQSKADLATAAVAALAAAESPVETDDPYADLVAELTAFHRGVSRPNGISLIGAMLHGSTHEELRGLFRSRVVTPRRRRLRRILERARAAGLIAQDSDLSYAVAACTGTRYAQALAGSRVGADWPSRTARLVWTAVGGSP